jgi:hypothetical protein
MWILIPITGVAIVWFLLNLLYKAAMADKKRKEDEAEAEKQRSTERDAAHAKLMADLKKTNESIALRRRAILEEQKLEQQRQSDNAKREEDHKNLYYC